MDAREPWQRIVRVEEVDSELVDRFTCGDERMDAWFLTKAATWCYLGFCQVYVALDESGIVGSYSLSPTSITPESLSNAMKRASDPWSIRAFCWEELQRALTCKKVAGELAAACYGTQFAGQPRLRL